MDEIRKIFGKANSVAPSLFSFNSKGACPVCKGMWKIVFDMAFADAVEVVCEECGGHRYNSAKDVPHFCKWGLGLITGGEHISRLVEMPQR